PVVEQVFEHPSGLNRPRLSGDGKRVAAECGDRKIRVWDVGGPRESTIELPADAFVADYRLNHDGSIAAAYVSRIHQTDPKLGPFGAKRGNSELFLWDGRTGAPQGPPALIERAGPDE